MPHVLQQLTADAWLLFATRFVRLFAYGALSVVLVFYLIGLGLTEAQTGLLLTSTLIGDTMMSLFLSTRADRVGRRRMLIVGAALMAAAGLVFASTSAWWLLLAAGTIGVISPSGHEVGPFLSIEQAALSQTISDRSRTSVFAWFTMVGSFATAAGALAGGAAVGLLQRAALEPQSSYRAVVVMYAAAGVILALLFSRLSGAAEASALKKSAAESGVAATPNAEGVRASRMGLDRSGPMVGKLSALFALDSFGGGFVIQSLAAYWFYLRWGVSPAALGGIFFVANVLAGLSALVAARLAARFGLINTMVATHLPSNVLLILVPLMPTLPLAIGTLLLRFCISQMDVPARQSYVMAVVPPAERSAAAGVTSVAKTLGAAISPVFAGFLFARPDLIDLPFFIAGTLKIIYDLLLYRAFITVRPPEETP
jgi:MFS family permease